jgi:hypothetical protein
MSQIPKGLGYVRSIPFFLKIGAFVSKPCSKEKSNHQVTLPLPSPCISSLALAWYMSNQNDGLDEGHLLYLHIEIPVSPISRKGLAIAPTNTFVIPKFARVQCGLIAQNTIITEVQLYCFFLKRYASWFVAQRVPWIEPVTPQMTHSEYFRGGASVYSTCWVTNHYK